MPDLFHIAWVDAGTAFNSTTHAVENEQVVSFHCTHEEGNFAILRIVLKSVRTKGLLSAGHKQWIWLSWTNPTTHVVEPLFYGRVTALASDMSKDLAELEFQARPSDFDTLKRALADSLRELPYYDPIFVAENDRDNPDRVLDGYFAFYHIDRISHAVSVSDGLVGEDGTEEFLEGELVDAGGTTSISQTPKSIVAVDAQVTWDQASEGSVGSLAVNMKSYTGSSFASGWASPDANIGDGYTAGPNTSVKDNTSNTTITGTYKFEDKSDAKQLNSGEGHNPGDTLSAELNYTIPVVNGSPKMPGADAQYEANITAGDPDTGKAPSLSSRVNWNVFVPSSASGTLDLHYKASRHRTEHVSFALQANLQQVIVDVDGNNVETLTLSGTDVGLDLARYDTFTGAKTIAETKPIVDPARRSYFPTARGIQSLQYLMLVARARLLKSARAYRVTQQITFARAITLSCRKNAHIHNHRLPGDEVAGKIVSYEFWSTERGELSGNVTIECAVGKGTTTATVEGSPTYVTADYVGSDYQRFTGNIQLTSTGDIGFSVPVDAPVDDGLVFPLTLEQVLVSSGMVGSSLSDQEAIIVKGSTKVPSPDLSFEDPLKQAQDQATAVQAAQQVVIDQLKATDLHFKLELKPINTGPFEVSYNIDTTPLDIPRQIDTEAAP